MNKIKIVAGIADPALSGALLADLRDCGYDAAAAPSLRAINAACRRLRPDLLLLDADMHAALLGLRQGRFICGGRPIPVVPVATGEKPRTARRAAAADAQSLAYPCPKRELVMAVEQALPGSITERYRSHFENVSDIVYTVDRTLTLASVSPSIRNILGYEPGELVGKRLALGRFVPAGKISGLMALFKRLLQGQSIGTVIIEVRAKNGATKTLEIKSGGLLAGADGPLLTGTARDISDWKHLTESLQDSEQRYRLLTETSPDMVFVVGPGGIVEYVNTMAVRSIGKPFDKVIGRKAGEFFPQRIAQRQGASIRKVFVTGKMVSVEDQTLLRGRAVWLDTWLVPVRNRQGKVASVMGVSRDVTERKRAEQALQLSEQQYRSTIDSMADAISVVDRELRIVLVNRRYQAWCGELGMRPVAIGRTIFQVFPFLPRAVRAEYARVFRSGKPLVTEETNRVAGREIVTETRKVPIIEQGRVLRAITIVRDITEGKLAERALRESEQINRAISGLTTDYSFIVDIGQRGRPTLRWVSANLKDITGRAISDAATPDLWRRIIHPGDRAAFAAFVKRSIATGTAGALECRSSGKDGGQRWVRIFVQPVRGGDGRVASIIGAVKDISERKRVETALRESEEKYRGLVEATDTGFVILDKDGRVLDANGEYLRLTGHGALSQIRGRPVTDWTAPYDLKRNRAAVAKCMRRGWVRTLEIDYLRRDGTAVPIEINATVIRTASGPQIVTLCRDITGRKRAERELRENLDKYQLLFNSINDSAWIQESRRRGPGPIIEVNHKACQRLGYRRAEMLGMTVADFDAPEQVARIKRTFNRIQREGHAVFEADHIAKDGHRVPMELSVSRINYQGRDAQLVVGRDITERKRAEQVLQQSEIKFRSFIEQAAEGIVILDEQGRIAEWNRAQQRIYGLSRAQTIGRYFWDVQYRLTPRSRRTPGQRQYFCDVVTKALKTGQSPIFDKPIIANVNCPDGALRYTEQRAFPIRTERGFRIGTVTMDVTDQKRLQQQLLEVGDQVQRKIGRDLHDGISQLLTVIALRLKALQQRLADLRAAEAGDAATIAEMIKRTMAEVIGLSRGLSPLSLERGGIVLALKELGGTTAVAGVSCTTAIDETARVPDLATATHLFRIAQEAVHNAVKHANASRIDITLRRERDALRLEVADNGRGMRTPDANAPGMGISLMRYRAGMIGATLELTRNQAGGTTVSCRFRANQP